MIPLAFFCYLLVFYVLPWHRMPLYQWVWARAPRHFPRLVLAAGGHAAFNGAFYLEMWLWWLGFVAGASLLHAAARRDDPQWETLLGGFARGGLRLAYTLLGLLTVGLVVLVLIAGYPVHGPLSLAVALLTTLILPSLFPSGRGRRGKAASSPGAPAGSLRGPAQSPGDPAQAAPPDTVAAEARSLRPEDLPQLDPDALARRVVQTVAPDTAARLIFRDFEFAGPPSSPPDTDTLPLRFSLALPPGAYLAELSRPRPVSPEEAAAALAEAAASPALRRAAARLADAAAGPGEILRLVLAFAAAFPETPASDGGPRLPVQVLHDGAATMVEKVWLAAALLRSQGMRVGLWRSPSGAEDAVAVADVYDPSAGTGDNALLRVAGGPAWRLYRPGLPAPEPVQGCVCELVAQAETTSPEAVRHD